MSEIKENLKFNLVPIEKCFINYNRSRWPDPKQVKKFLAKLKEKN